MREDKASHSILSNPFLCMSPFVGRELPFRLVQRWGTAWFQGLKCPVTAACYRTAGRQPAESKWQGPYTQPLPKAQFQPHRNLSPCGPQLKKSTASSKHGLKEVTPTTAAFFCSLASTHQLLRCLRVRTQGQPRDCPGTGLQTSPRQPLKPGGHLDWNASTFLSDTCLK